MIPIRSRQPHPPRFSTLTFSRMHSNEERWIQIVLLSSIKNRWHRFARSTYQAFTMKYSKLYHDRFRIKFSRRLPNRTYPGDGRRGTLSLRYGVFVNKLHAQSIRNIDRKLLGAYRIFDAQNGVISRWNIRRTTCLLDVFHFLSFSFLFRLLGSRGRGFQRVTNIHVL